MMRAVDADVLMLSRPSPTASNRTKCLDAAIPERILGLLAHLHSDETDDPLTLVPTIKAATGALLNLVIDTRESALLLLRECL